MIIIKLVDDFNKVISKLTKKSMHSIRDIETFYKKINKNDLSCLQLPNKLDIQIEFSSLFDNYESKTDDKVFPLASLNSKIYEAEENLNKIGYHDSRRNELEIELNELKSSLKQVNPFSQYVKFFVGMMNRNDFISYVIILENLLINFKNSKLESLRKQQSTKQSELEQLMEKIKYMESSLIVKMNCY
jgi:hypothetical protein